MKIQSLVWLTPLFISQIISRTFPMDKEWYQKITENLDTPSPIVFL